MCGNGIKQNTEVCDDGNNNSGDGCNSTCGLIEANYVCNLTSTPNACFRCGNGVLEYLEACDDGNNVANDGCSATCTIETNGYCDAAKTSCAKCGNGNRQVAPSSYTEACDDGNTVSNDGCSSDCKTIETGYACTLAIPNVCTPTCGDGLKVGIENCDDGTNDGVGCKLGCQTGNVTGWNCTGGSNVTATICGGICGDGLRVADENCDDGTNTNLKGCNNGCKTGPMAGWYC